MWNETEFNKWVYTCTETIACTSDIWSGRTKTGYLCVTVHYVNNNWTFQRRLITFQNISYLHDANVIYNTIMEVFDLYGIKEKILSITFDNASINNTVINLFKITLRLPHGGTLFHQKCACHVINLCSRWHEAFRILLGKHSIYFKLYRNC